MRLDPLADRITDNSLPPFNMPKFIKVQQTGGRGEIFINPNQVTAIKPCNPGGTSQYEVLLGEATRIAIHADESAKELEAYIMTSDEYRRHYPHFLDEPATKDRADADTGSTMQPNRSSSTQQSRSSSKSKRSASKRVADNPNSTKP
jgi:hypothetical protein